MNCFKSGAKLTKPPNMQVSTTLHAPAVLAACCTRRYWWDEVWSKTLPAFRSSSEGDPFEGLEISKDAFGEQACEAPYHV